MNPISQLQLRDYSLVSLHVDANPNFEEPKDGVSKEQLGVDFDFGKQEKALVYKIDLRVQCNFPQSAFYRNKYRIKIHLQSFFEFDPSFPEQDVPKMLIPNGLAMSYSIARGIVAQATGTSLHGKFVLPTVNFVEIFKEKVAKLKKKKLNSQATP